MIELGLVANEIPMTVKNVITIKAAGDSWLHQSMTRRRKPIRQNTARIYGHYLARWIYPPVGEIPAPTRITLTPVARLSARRRIGRCAPSRAGNTHSCGRTMVPWSI
jgi:hypothetical protein